MVHEPFYVSGTYANEEVGLCVGWVSHGGSFSDCMPLWNERRDSDPPEIPRGGQVGGHVSDGWPGRSIDHGLGQPVARGALPCYTFGGAYRACADLKIARRIAMLCGQSHRTIAVGADFLTKFPSLAERAVFLSDGAMDVTGAVELYANRIARQIAPVRLTGNYGSEIFRGNVAFRPKKLTEALLEPEFAQSVRTAVATYQAERNGHSLSFIAFKQLPWHHYARLAIEQSQLTLRSPYLDNDLVALMYRAPCELLSSTEPSLRLIHEGNPLLTKLPTDRGLVYSETPIIGKISQAVRGIHR